MLHRAYTSAHLARATDRYVHSFTGQSFHQSRTDRRCRLTAARTARLLSRELSDPHTTVDQARLDDVQQTLVGVCIWKKEREVTMEELMKGVVDDEDEAIPSIEEEQEDDTKGVDEGFCWQYYAGSESRRRQAMSGRGRWW